MRTIKYILFLLVVNILLSNCIDRYYPETLKTFTSNMVIEGFISDVKEIQEIKVSKSASPDSVRYMPYSGCEIFVEDDKGNKFVFEESLTNPGSYLSSIDKQFLKVGQKFKLFLQAPNGNQYESDYEEVLSSPSIESLHYKLERIEKLDDVFTEDGLQFFVDLNASEDNSSYYMWTIEETFEYHSTWPILEFFDANNRRHKVPIDYSRYVCYKSIKVEDIFVLSTEGFSEKKYDNYRLHFVNDRTQKLLFNYSILVHQHAISEKAYLFWKNLKENNQEDADIFNKQPSIVESNIYNVNDPDETVLGFFGVSSAMSKRIVVDSVDGLTFSQVQYCKPIKIEMGLPFEPRPLHIIRYEDEKGPAMGWAPTECFDCTLKGGTLEKPPYFD